MARRVSSRVFVGRQAEIRVIEGTLKRIARTRQATVLLLGGEAGIGKTRLIQETLIRARAIGWLVLEGSCTGVDSAPHALAILDDLLEQLKTITAEAAELELQARAEPARLPHLMGRLLSKISIEQPVVLVVEDAHWADHSTRNLLLGLSRALNGQVLLILSYRDDEMVPGHSLLPVLASIHRSADCEELQLGPLSLDESVELMMALGSQESEQVATALHERSGGNPLFLEEMLAAAPEKWSAGARHALLARIRALGPHAVEVAEMVSLDSSCEAAVLASAFASAQTEFTSAFDALVERHILEEAGGVRFRHALIQEVVAATIPPMRRRNLHRALAEARSRLCPDEPEAIARHWREADVRHEAFVWAIAAGRAAVDRGAPPEAADWFESALADWERILSAETVAGMAYFDLVRLAEFAMVRSRQFDRAAAILVRALESPDRLVPGEESMAWFFLSLHIGLSGDKGVWPFSAREALERARLSLSEATPDLLRLIVLSSYIVNVLLCFADEVAAGKAWADAECMIDHVPGQIPPIVVAARACLLSYQGCSEASAAIAACEAPDIVAIRRDGPESWLRPMLGAHEENVRACAEGIERATRERNLSVAGFTLFSSMSLSLTALGRWQEALDAWRTLRAEVSDDVLLDGRQTVLRGWGPLFVRTANHDLLQPYLAQDPNRSNNGPLHHLPTEALVEVELARTRGDWQHAASNIEHLLASLHGRVLFAQAAQAVSWAVTALADAAFSRTIDPDTATEMASRWIRRLESGLNTNQRRPGEHDAVDYLAQAEAERLRIRGDDSSDNWRALADAWASAGRPFNEAYARFRLAFHLLTAQSGHPMRTRALARQELRRAAELAEALGASLLSSDVRSLALSAGISLTGRRAQRLEVTRSPQTAAALTPRERQVARLLSEGLTNGQIGLTLGMSPKTASVHVGNIMDKLGAANRVQAAILIRTNGPVATAKTN